jgi:hypothetical protein
MTPEKHFQYSCITVFPSLTLKTPYNFTLQKQMHIMKMAVFWVVAPCSLVEIDRRFRDAYCLHHQGNDRNISEDSHLHTRRREILKSHHNMFQ